MPQQSPCGPSKSLPPRDLLGLSPRGTQPQPMAGLHQQQQQQQLSPRGTQPQPMASLQQQQQLSPAPSVGVRPSSPAASPMHGKNLLHFPCPRLQCHSMLRVSLFLPDSSQ
ncbi:hypothetical protein ElyMa_002404300 [Elysia marginata]|uniref:Uncharacterized protein n=1 Tax=Elysia marginata TaxID=1093978 RepID=A0AAV4GF17_9GAST|nr:hypothetical protein ElyMa_002404300 [Elysia marginata]